MRAMSKAKNRKPWTGFEWALVIAFVLIALLALTGWEILGWGDVLRLARRVIW